MSNKDTWEHLKPEVWRTLAPGFSEVEDVDQRVRKDGPDAFSYLEEIIETDDDAKSEVRCRAMGWLVSLYGYPNVDKNAIVEVLRNVVDSTLKLDWSQTRRDALMALARLKQNAWDDEFDLDYLLKLASDTELSHEVIQDALLALAETRSPEAIRPLAFGILRSRHRGLTSRLVRGMLEICAEDWEEKARAFVEPIKDHSLSGADVDAGAVVSALSPSPGEDQARRLTKIGNFFIEQSRGCDERVARVFAKLLIASEGGDQIQAGHRINEYQKDHKIPALELDNLRKAVGGGPALSGVMGVLARDLETYFQKPIHQLNEDTRVSWEKAVDSARKGLVMRLWMSGTVFVVGISLLVISSMRMLFGNSSSTFDSSTFIPFASGLGTMLLIIYTGPLKEIRQAVTDLATASAAFIAYVHQVLETSHTFSFYYMHEKIDFEEMKKSSAIIMDAMTSTIQALNTEAKSSSEDTYTKALEDLRAAIPGVGETTTEVASVEQLRAKQ